MRKGKLVVSGVAVLFVALAGAGLAVSGAQDQRIAMQASPPRTQAPASAWNARLREQNNSGQSGTAALTATADRRTRVEIQLSSPGPGNLPAHIHVGPCGSLDPRPRYTLNPSESGRSDTIVPVELQSLLEGKFSIRVRQTGADTAVACGEIVGG